MNVNACNSFLNPRKQIVVKILLILHSSVILSCACVLDSIFSLSLKMIKTVLRPTE